MRFRKCITFWTWFVVDSVSVWGYVGVGVSFCPGAGWAARMRGLKTGGVKLFPLCQSVSVRDRPRSFQVVLWATCKRCKCAKRSSGVTDEIVRFWCDLSVGISVQGAKSDVLFFVRKKINFFPTLNKSVVVIKTKRVSIIWIFLKPPLLDFPSVFLNTIFRRERSIRWKKLHVARGTKKTNLVPGTHLIVY